MPIETELLTKETIAQTFAALQDRICAGLEQADGKSTFIEDSWQHISGGGGKSRIIQHGNVIEKGGVNFSAVSGVLPAFVKEAVNPTASRFFATGVSIVIHPFSPHVPIIHMNVRYFETDAGDRWFGGGIDLTPIYVNQNDSTFFHRILKTACDRFDVDYYNQFKSWADDYFFIKHRNETRGVGGIFFDHLKANEKYSIHNHFEFVQAIGNAFLDCYLPIVEKNKSVPFSEREKQWQLVRRGRYVEFNLIYDKGTRFGLETGGRVESILMSLPEHCSWIYDFKVQPQSAESDTLAWLRKGVNWLSKS